MIAFKLIIDTTIKVHDLKVVTRAKYFSGNCLGMKKFEFIERIKFDWYAFRTRIAKLREMFIWAIDRFPMS